MAGLMQWQAAPGTNAGDGHTINTGARFGTPTPNNNASHGANASVMLLYLQEIHVWFTVKVMPLTPEVGLDIGHISVIPLHANSSVDRGITWSEALALEAFSLMQDDGATAKCSSCSDVGQLKKCERPGCTYALCFWKSNMQPCVRDLGPGEFWCPPCWSRRRSTPLPYSVVAQGAYIADRIYARRPLVFHTIALKLNAYPERLLRCQLEEEFLPWKNMLCCTNIELVTGAACLPNVRARVRDALALVKARSVADFLVLIDTHSDYENGELVHSVDKHGNVWTQDATEVFRHHFGPELWKRSLDMTGIKGMILLACGPAFTQLSHFEKIKSLVSSKRLQFIIGFTAHSVQPSVVMPFMLQTIVEVYIHQKPVQLALEQQIANWTLLSHTPVVLV
ncbi:uncharacterized protein F5891DRAFT_985014 [Suillus fuscotomentosus]|uniref:Uncharacterized protein n=1 Tax=Suillus fuscotomentosus TaxID=1912939 RepID=A0AAD4DV59_9AGAM|nr:uncharacterized protein F5891DRAFT_985014 [Suillus fuscotomentosus]KAG1894531.1 hypothetical protein F5891DRAFT_985014 [Suillus fuscotomentosus]